MFHALDRRRFLALATAALARGEERITRPIVSEEGCPLEPIQNVQGFLRKPPGKGPFPAIVWIHGGLVTIPLDSLRDLALNKANPSRFLAAGYVVAIPTYRSRDHDPQSTASLEDCLGTVNAVKRLPEVDKRSVIVYGCSGGGDLALEVAAATEVCAIVPEEPASFIFAGIFNAKFPKKGERLTPPDSIPIGRDPKGYYTPEYQKLTRAKIAKIRCPILIIQGDQNWVVPFNNQVLIPELRALGKNVETITYPGEPHCFGFAGNERPEAGLKMFRDMDAFCRRYVVTKPKAIDYRLVTQVPLASAA
jgi:dipeptidyl aminopeptidase/acylaminoacyl peptidase